MTDHDALAVPDRCIGCGEIESNRWHHEPDRPGWHPFAACGHAQPAGVRVTGNAGLRKAVERWLHAREYERMDAEGAVAALLGYEWDDTRGDGEWVKSAAFTGDTPEADR